MLGSRIRSPLDQAVAFCATEASPREILDVYSGYSPRGTDSNQMLELASGLTKRAWENLSSVKKVCEDTRDTEVNPGDVESLATLKVIEPAKDLLAEDYYPALLHEVSEELRTTHRLLHLSLQIQLSLGFPYLIDSPDSEVEEFLIGEESERLLKPTFKSFWDSHLCSRLRGHGLSTPNINSFVRDLRQNLEGLGQATLMFHDVGRFSYILSTQVKAQFVHILRHEDVPIELKKAMTETFVKDIMEPYMARLELSPVEQQDSEEVALELWRQQLEQIYSIVSDIQLKQLDAVCNVAAVNYYLVSDLYSHIGEDLLEVAETFFKEACLSPSTILEGNALIRAGKSTHRTF